MNNEVRYRGRFRALGDSLESYTRITQRGTITMLINPSTTASLFPLVTSMTGDREAHPKITFGYNNFFRGLLNRIPPGSPSSPTIFAASRKFTSEGVHLPPRIEMCVIIITQKPCVRKRYLVESGS